MTFARIVAVVAALASVPAFATVRHSKKHAKHSHIAARKTSKKKAFDRSLAAPRDEAKSEDTPRLAQADRDATNRDAATQNHDGEDGDVASGGSRRVITHSTATDSPSDNAE